VCIGPSRATSAGHRVRPLVIWQEARSFRPPRRYGDCYLAAILIAAHTTSREPVLGGSAELSAQTWVISIRAPIGRTRRSSTFPGNNAAATTRTFPPTASHQAIESLRLLFATHVRRRSFSPLPLSGDDRAWIGCHRNVSHDDASVWGAPVGSRRQGGHPNPHWNAHPILAAAFVHQWNRVNTGRCAVSLAPMSGIEDSLLRARHAWRRDEPIGSRRRSPSRSPRRSVFLGSPRASYLTRRSKTVAVRLGYTSI